MAATALCVAFFVLRLWDADIRIPFKYEAGSDATFTEAFVKAIIDHGWFFSNPSLAAPAGADWFDFPQPSFWHFSILRVLGLIARDFGIAINVYYLASYPLIAAAGLYALRQAKIATPIAFACALLFAFIPDHMMRNEAHLFYALFYSIPLMSLTLLCVARGEALWYRRPGRRFVTPTRAGWFALAASLLTAWDNQYHATFVLVFLTVAAGIGWARTRTLRPVATGALLAAIIIGGVALEVLPTLAYDAQHGKNTAVAHRLVIESEMYALKLTQLVLPVAQHRIPALAAMRHDYDADTASENPFAALGIVGAAGFAGLILILVLPWRPAAYGRELHDLAGLNLAAFLLGTIGGLGALIAFFLTPEIRAYGRISPYISWFSLFAVAIFAQLALRRVARERQRLATYCTAAALVAIGLFDQTSHAYFIDYPAAAALRNSDAGFVARLETELPPGSRIFEIPYISFPESPPVNALLDYSELRPYLFSHALRWSFGALRGTRADAFERSVAELPPAQISPAAARDGFAGIVVFRAGYADHGAAIEAVLQSQTHVTPVVSTLGDLAFYRLQPPPNALDDTQLQREINAIVDVRFDTGFYAEESDGHQHWHWAANAARLALENAGGDTVPVTLTFRLRTPAPAKVTIRGAGVDGTFAALPEGNPLTLSLKLRPGTNSVDFSTDAPALPVADVRRLVFAVVDLTVKSPSGASVVR